MEWVDITKEMVTEEVQLVDQRPMLVYSHKFGPVLNLIYDNKIVALSGMKSGNYKAEIEYVEGSEDMTLKVFMREPAENFKKR